MADSDAGGDQIRSGNNEHDGPVTTTETNKIQQQTSVTSSEGALPKVQANAKQKSEYYL